MAKIFSFAWWNVRHFSGKPERVGRVVGLLREKNPDVFAIFEVQGKQVFEELMQAMPTHSFFITENTVQSDMEILVGTRNTIQSFVTQREEFRSMVPTLRPGALATLRIGGLDYALLFIHPKSFDEPRDWGLRDDMFKHVASLKRTLDRGAAAGETARFICLGDLNTMGMSAAYNEKSDLTDAEEIRFLERRMKSVTMRRLSKTHEATWWNGKETQPPGSLDQAFADASLNFGQIGGKDIQVFGWPEKPTLTEKLAWIAAFSDHALLYGEVHPPPHPL
jgi:hypothetical protein